MRFDADIPLLVGMVLVLPCGENADKNEKLAEKLRSVSEKRESAQIGSPVKSKIKVRELDNSITPHEIMRVISKAACCEFEISVDETRQISEWSFCTVFAIYPARMLQEACRKGMEWWSARVDANLSRHLQCSEAGNLVT